MVVISLYIGGKSRPGESRRPCASSVQYEHPFFDTIFSLPRGFDAGMHGMLELHGICKRWRRPPFYSLSDAEMERLRTRCGRFSFCSPPHPCHKGGQELRYKETGEVHNGLPPDDQWNDCLPRRTYGEKFLDEVFRRTAHDVYRSIHNDLKRGDPEQLVAHWSWFFDREKGEYVIERKGEEIRMTVKRVPRSPISRGAGSKIDPAFCRQTVVVNTALREGTPFEITTECWAAGGAFRRYGGSGNDPSDHFVRFYNEVFKALDARGMNALSRFTWSPNSSHRSLSSF